MVSRWFNRFWNRLWTPFPTVWRTWQKYSATTNLGVCWWNVIIFVVSFSNVGCIFYSPEDSVHYVVLITHSKTSFAPIGLTFSFLDKRRTWRYCLFPWDLYSVDRCPSQSDWSHNWSSIWPRITNFYTDIPRDILYSHTGYYVTIGIGATMDSQILQPTERTIWLNCAENDATSYFLKATKLTE